MKPSPDLLHQLFAEEVARARARSPADKLLEGARLFDRSCRVMRDGIRHRHPELDEAGVEATRRKQLALVEQAERRP